MNFRTFKVNSRFMCLPPPPSICASFVSVYTHIAMSFFFLSSNIKRNVTTIYYMGYPTERVVRNPLDWIDYPNKIKTDLLQTLLSSLLCQKWPRMERRGKTIKLHEYLGHCITIRVKELCEKFEWSKDCPPPPRKKMRQFSLELHSL